MKRVRNNFKQSNPTRKKNTKRLKKGRLDKKIGLWLRDSAFVIGVAVLLVVVMLTALISLDLPFRAFDVFLGHAASHSPSNWYSIGEVWMLISIFMLIVATRCLGGRVTAYAQGLAWLACALITMLFLFSIKSELTPDDMPAGRFVVSFLFSWYLAQILAIQFYDLKRGGAWWQAPLTASLVAFLVQSGVFFVTTFVGKSVPWGMWFLIDLLLKGGLVCLFLPIYWLLRHKTRPYLGNARFHTLRFKRTST